MARWVWAPGMRSAFWALTASQCPSFFARTPSGGRSVVGVAASFNALLVLVLRVRGSLLGAFLGVLLGAQSLRLVLFLGLFLVDDLCEELLHLLGHAGG